MARPIATYRKDRPGVGGMPGRQVNPRIAVTFDAADMAEISRRAGLSGCSSAHTIRQLVKSALAMMEA